MLGGAIFAGAFIAWAWFGTVQEVSSASGRLVPRGEVYKVQPVVEGKITRLHVKEGDSVKAHQVLVEFDAELPKSQVQQLQQTLTGYQTELRQIQALIEQHRLDAANRQAIAQAGVETHQFAIRQAQTDITTQQRLLRHFQQDATASTARLERLQPLANEGAIAREQLFDVEQALRDRQRSSTESEGALAKSQATLKQLEAQLAQKNAEKSQTELDSQQHLQRLRLRETELQSKIATAKTALKAAQTQLQQQTLRASVSGVVSTLNVKNTGEVAQAGQTIAELAPVQSPLIVDTLLPSREAGFVKPGMPTEVKFEAFPYQDYGTISGRVLTVSPDATINEKAGAVYTVKVSLDRAYIVHEGQRIPLKAGQTATVEIITRQQRIVDILLEPIRKLQRDRLTL
jgi:HlyD family type I secretion membrane fusion protein